MYGPKLKSRPAPTLNKEYKQTNKNITIIRFLNKFFSFILYQYYKLNCYAVITLRLDKGFSFIGR